MKKKSRTHVGHYLQHLRYNNKNWHYFRSQSSKQPQPRTHRHKSKLWRARMRDAYTRTVQNLNPTNVARNFPRARAHIYTRAPFTRPQISPSKKATAAAARNELTSRASGSAPAILRARTIQAYICARNPSRDALVEKYIGGGIGRWFRVSESSLCEKRKRRVITRKLDGFQVVIGIGRIRWRACFFNGESCFF